MQYRVKNLPKTKTVKGQIYLIEYINGAFLHHLMQGSNKKSIEGLKEIICLLLEYLFYVFYSTKCDIEIYHLATLSGLGDIIGSLNNDGRKTTMVE